MTMRVIRASLSILVLSLMYSKASGLDLGKLKPVFSSAEYCLRVFLRISLTCFSTFDFGLIVISFFVFRISQKYLLVNHANCSNLF